MSDLDRLVRWESSGGTWQVLARTPVLLTIALCRCDGGEEVDRFSTSDPAVRAHVGDRETDEDTEPDAED